MKRHRTHTFRLSVVFLVAGLSLIGLYLIEVLLTPTPPPQDRVHYDEVFQASADELRKRVHAQDLSTTASFFARYYDKEPYRMDYELYEVAGDVYAANGDFLAARQEYEKALTLLRDLKLNQFPYLAFRTEGYRRFERICIEEKIAIVSEGRTVDGEELWDRMSIRLEQDE